MWSEWNGKYRDTVRDFWRGHEVVPELASRLTGSSDLYQEDGRRPVASVNFVTCHDGFTLADLVTYGHKHNEANGENNRDGTDDNRSWNHGVEGPSEHPDVAALRRRQVRNFLATLFLSQGVVMLSHGDEISRTQGGNNNAYCQDNEISWVDWKQAAEEEDLLDFVRGLARLRREHPVFRRRRFFQGRPPRGGELRDIAWLRPDGGQMSEQDWGSAGRALGVFLNGAAITEPDLRGRRVSDDSFLMLLNSGADAVDFTVPGRTYGATWETVLDTNDPDVAGRPLVSASGTVRVVDRALVLLKRVSRRRVAGAGGV